MYLPVAALFLIQVRGFSVSEAGIALGVGAAVGLASRPLRDVIPWLEAWKAALH